MHYDTHIATLFDAMVEYDASNTHRIAHFTKVHGYASSIGLLEGLDVETQFTLESAALVHDIGIKKCIELYQNSSGHLQESEGPAIAEHLLTSLSFPQTVIERVCFLVGHHHTYTDIQGLDYQILVESDFLVNLEEKHAEIATVKHTYDTIFKTETGKRFCRRMFGLDREAQPL